MDIQDKVALVTGGASGLGAATVRRLVAGGGRAAVVDRDGERARALAAELGGAAKAFQADVGDEASVAAAVAGTVAAFGRIDIALNCAGIGLGRTVVNRDGARAPLDAFEHVMRVNLIGTYTVLCQVAEQMVKNIPNAEGERGVIINTASIAAYDGQMGQTAYAASKGGVVGMTLPAARDLARYGIRVIAIAPGYIQTPLLESVGEAALENLRANTVFPPRLGRADEYARLACAIIDNPMLNGETIRMDGAVRLLPR